MTDWLCVPQMVWSLYVLIDCVRLGKVGLIGALLYVLLFAFVLLITRSWCVLRAENEVREERRQREREERLAALPPWPWGSK